MRSQLRAGGAWLLLAIASIRFPPRLVGHIWRRAMNTLLIDEAFDGLEQNLFLLFLLDAGRSGGDGGRRQQKRGTLTNAVQLVTFRQVPGGKNSNNYANVDLIVETAIKQVRCCLFRTVLYTRYYITEIAYFRAFFFSHVLPLDILCVCVCFQAGGPDVDALTPSVARVFCFVGVSFPLCKGVTRWFRVTVCCKIDKSIFPQSVHCWGRKMKNLTLTPR